MLVLHLSKVFYIPWNTDFSLTFYHILPQNSILRLSKSSLTTTLFYSHIHNLFQNFFLSAWRWSSTRSCRNDPVEVTISSWSGTCRTDKASKRLVNYMIKPTPENSIEYAYILRSRFGTGKYSKNFLLQLLDSALPILYCTDSFRLL